ARFLVRHGEAASPRAARADGLGGRRRVGWRARPDRSGGAVAGHRARLYSRPAAGCMAGRASLRRALRENAPSDRCDPLRTSRGGTRNERSEEHTSELQSRRDLVCRLLLEKKKKHI